jgi:hypothetical protein
MKNHLIVILLLLSVIVLNAQELSFKKGILLSALTPGLGQIYSQNYTKAGIFLSAEIAIVFSYFRFKAEKDWAIESYQKFAWNIAEVPLQSEDNYYQLIQDYMSSEAYNQNVESFARNVFLSTSSPFFDPDAYYQYLEQNLIPVEFAWDWQNNRNWSRYQSLRRDKQDYEIYANFAVAALILNRLVSVVDSAISIRKHNRAQTLLGNLKFQPDLKKKGIKISYEYKF